MKNKYPLKIILTALMLGSFGQAFAATIDTKNLSTQTGSTHFVALNATDPVRLAYNDDWDWAHNKIAGSFTSATLKITAYDVDSKAGEQDDILAFDRNLGTEGDWVKIGSLTGGDGALGGDHEWSVSTFTLGESWFDEINAGLLIKIDIDVAGDTACTSTSTSVCWVVALSQSELSVETAPVPVPAAVWLLGSGLLGLAGVARRKAA